MKKILLILTMVMVIFTNSFALATLKNDVPSFQAEISGEIVDKTTENKEEMTQASDKILANMSKKDKKIAEYTDKYNNETFGVTAYYLEVIQLYSIPVFIILLTIGAFNFYIIGEKKLDKKQQGFSFIMSALCGLVVFQVLPFLFALLVAGK